MKPSRAPKSLLALLLVTWPASPGFGQTPDSHPGALESSASVSRQLLDDRFISDTFEEVASIRQTAADQLGLTLGSDYNFLVQGTDGGDLSGSSGALRFYGTWALPCGETPRNGQLTFKVENRQRVFDPVAPQQLGPALGSSGLTGITWSDAGWIFSNLFWRQQTYDNRASLIFGIVDVTDYVDVYGLVNPWTDFTNSVFGTSPTLAAPSQGLGAAFRYNFTPNVYMVSGVADANADASDPANAFDSLFDRGETLKHVEIGHIGSWENRVEDNIHLTLWHSDERPEAGVPEGSGIAFSASHLFDDRWLPFFRAGWSNGGGGMSLERSIAAGLGCYFRDRKDLLAAGVHFGQPSGFPATPDGLQDETTIEILYRRQLMGGLTVTPDLQLVFNPAYDSDEDFVAVFGLRARIAF